MSALTEERNTVQLLGAMSYEREVASSNTVYAGALVAQNSDGKAVPASDTSGLIVLGRAENTAAAGKKTAIGTGIFILDNGTSTEALAVTDIGSAAYVIDDHTVGKVGGTNKIPAGIVVAVTTEGVSVEVTPVAVGAAAAAKSAAAAAAE